jgi:hypothetical protein
MIARQIDRPIPKPSGLRGEEGVEDALEILRVHARARNTHGDEHAA